MGKQIIKQPDGKYAVWSSIVDNFIYVNCGKQDIIDYLIEESKEEIIRNVEGVVAKLEKGKKPYFQFTKTWEEALEWIEEVHGKKGVKQLLKKMGE